MRTLTEGGKGTHPKGRMHWGDPANQPGQWEER